MAMQEPPEFCESFLNYKISTGERILNDYFEEVELYRDKIYSTKGQIAKLKEENEQCLKNLVEQMKEYERAMDNAEKVGKEVVEKALENKFQYLKSSDEEVEALQGKIAECEKEICSLQQELAKWTLFKDVTHPEYSSKIESLKDELQEMKDVEEREESELEVKWAQFREEMQKKNDILQEEQKEALIQNLHTYLDPKSLAEFRDNSWLHRELVAQRNAFVKLKAQTTALEEENLELMDSLLRASDNEVCESWVLPVVVDPGRIPSATIGPHTGTRTGRGMVSDGESKRSRSELRRKAANRKIQSWEECSLESLGLVELNKLRVKGKSPLGKNTSRPQSQEQVHLPPLVREGEGHSQCSSTDTKKRWPISAGMLRTIF